MPTLSIHQVRHVTKQSRAAIDHLISRGHFTPSMPAQRGTARKFTEADTIRMGALAELLRVGLDAKTASRATQRIIGYRDDDAVLIVWRAAEDEPGQLPRHKVVRARDAVDAVRDRTKRALALVNLNAIEERVTATLNGGDDAEGDDDA